MQRYPTLLIIREVGKCVLKSLWYTTTHTHLKSSNELTKDWSGCGANRALILLVGV